MFFGVRSGAGSEDLDVPASFVKGCSFHYGLNSAVATLYDSNGVEISNNVIFGTVDTAIITDSAANVIINNVIGNVFHSQLWLDALENSDNEDFGDHVTPSGIDTKETSDVIITGNRVSGVTGACFSGRGESCDKSAACNDIVTESKLVNNAGRACLQGFFNFRDMLN